MRVNKGILWDFGRDSELGGEGGGDPISRYSIVMGSGFTGYRMGGMCVMY